MGFELSRRHLLAGLALVAVPAQAASPIIVHRDPGCGCCEKWTGMARRILGRPIRVIEDPNRAALHRQIGMPANLASCHTALIDGLAFEGHVPFADVKRLLATKPRGVRGLAVPGMPLGSPGMEVPGMAPHNFAVLSFGSNAPAIYSRH
ncbi:DUF411 domain-containing protein [Sphingobium sp. DEHP117]|nr:DUF411 domain-containing protein [Sphingobium sp. DEHP117]MDQ4421607.1 DUF411 domain-containing protein [Sphingobium sp. DEHP117]